MSHRGGDLVRWPVTGMIGRIVVALLIGVLAILPGAGRASGSVGRAGRITIGGVVAVATDPYFITMECGATAEAKTLGVDIKWGTTASSAVSAETAVLNSIEATQPDGILLAPFSNTAFVAPVQSLMQKGTPVVLVDAPLIKPVAYQAFYTDNLVAGRALAKPLAQAIGGHGTVAILTFGAGDIVQDLRWQGLKQVLAAQYPKITVLQPQYVGVDAPKAAAATSALLLAHPNLSAIFSTEGPAGAGAASALLAAHKRGVVKLFSFDAIPVEVQGLRSGAYQGLVAQSPYLEGSDGVKALVSYLRQGHHGPVHSAKPYVVGTPVKVLTRANVDLPSSKPYLYRGSCSG